MKSNSDHERFMFAAITEAKKGVGLTSPNPAVGAVLVIQGRIAARGHHRQAGLPHAEIECLRNFGCDVPNDAVLYVTLEPCSTTGRTRACTTQLIDAGVRKIVVGAIDPNPRHAGRGLEILRAARIDVQIGILSDECASLNEAFNKWIVTGQPFVIAKCGMSLDGRLTRPPGEPRWITNVEARRHARALRAEVDAIVVGATTVRTDNPRLTAREGRQTSQPWRVILTRSGKLPRTTRLFSDAFAERTLVYQGKPLGAVLSDLGKRNVTSVLIEGGGDVLGQTLDAHLIDKVQLYLGDIFTGGPVIGFPGRGADATQDAAYLDRIAYERLGQNICVTGYPRFKDEKTGPAARIIR